MDKAPDAFRTISEVAGELGVPQHVLRFWETRFSQIRPMKRGGGRRYYRPSDVDLLKGIKYLLYGEGFTIKGVQRILKEEGAKYVQSVWADDPRAFPLEAEEPPVPAPEPERAPAPKPEDVPERPVASSANTLPPLPDLDVGPTVNDAISAPDAPQAPPHVDEPPSESVAPQKAAPESAKGGKGVLGTFRLPSLPFTAMEAEKQQSAPEPSGQAEPDGGTTEAELPPSAAEPARAGVSEAQKRLLKSALYELAECRRILADSRATR